MSSREAAVERLKRRFRRYGLARLEMLVIISVTAIVGFFASVALLALGLRSMAVRYPLAALLAYGSFLLAVRVWAELHRREPKLDSDIVDALDIVVDGFPLPLPDVAPGFAGGGGGGGVSGGGGDFGGGGASGSWNASSAGATPSGGTGGGGGGGSIGDLLDLDEGWAVIVVIVALIGGVIAAFFVVWSAPALLAELVLDVALVSRLYQRVKHLERRSWLRTAVRKTWVAALVVVLLAAAAGTALQLAAPGADSIGDTVVSD
jgi:hypothetical protein